MTKLTEISNILNEMLRIQFPEFRISENNGDFFKYKIRKLDFKKLSPCHKIKFSIPISLKPDGVNFCYF